MNDAREAILARIAEALRAPAAHPSFPVPPAIRADSATTAPFREVLPPVPADETSQIALFAGHSADLRTEFRECASPQAAAQHLATLAGENGWARLAFHPGPIIDAVIPYLPDSLQRLAIEPGYDRDLLERCDAGLTECEALVAQTGSICVTARSSGGRVLSVLPPHHIVLAQRAQVVPDLTAAYEQLAKKYAGDYPSFISFITGPSRTGDIERILVLGAHGPKKLTVLLLP